MPTSGVGARYYVGLTPTPDIRLVQNTFFPKYSVTIDWQLLDDGTLDDSEALASAVVCALGSNRLASLDDVLPDPDSSDRQGWWGDMNADTIWGGWPLGSRLWLCRRSKITQNPTNAYGANTVVMIRNFIYECIQPFIDQKIASTFTAEVRQTDSQTIKAWIKIFRGPTPTVQLLYEVLWQGVQP
jgi:phage gp46-like protein